MTRNNEGQSVASMWGNMVTLAAAGEIVAVDNKFGETVAVMLSVEKFEELTGIDLLADARGNDEPD
jgi:hypothetical protein